MIRLTLPARLALLRSRAIAVLAVVPLAVAVSAGAAAPAAAATAATAATDGSWWYTALHIAQDHEIADGTGATIALLDGPVDNTIPELQGQRVEAGVNYCDVVGAVSRPHPSPFAKGLQSSFHATSMAALLVGNGKGTRPDGTGLRGIAPGATLRVYAIAEAKKFRCDHLIDAKNHVEGLGSIWPKAVRQAVDDGADVIALPFGSAGIGDIEATQYAAAHGVVVVAAVGNGINTLTGKKQYGLVGPPAINPGVVAVAAYDRRGYYFPGAARGTDVVMTAPGVDIGSGSVDRSGRWSSAGTQTGTSASTVFVAGMVAVVKGKYPTATAGQLVQHLVRHTSRPKLAWDDTYGYGPASLTNMLAADPTKNPDDNPLLELVYQSSDLSRWTETVPHPNGTAVPTPATSRTASTAPAAGGPGNNTAAAQSKRSVVRSWAIPAVSLLAAVALLLGGVLLLRRRSAAGISRAPETQGG